MNCQSEPGIQSKSDKSGSINLDELQLDKTECICSDISISDLLFQSDIVNLPAWEFPSQTEKASTLSAMDIHFQHMQSFMLQIDSEIQKLNDKWEQQQHRDLPKLLQEVSMDVFDKVSKQKMILSSSSSPDFLLLQEFFVETLEEGMVKRAISKVGEDTLDDFLHALDSDGVQPALHGKTLNILCVTRDHIKF
ncbi:unnamed protein product [Cuscuta epithymum]|uniref:Uncharacterized protein n=1 Tax=Cuscuta epithymum TaxID=186058 RepID=A0AAV0E539_9ASTE|nr:unnamed protein product [Cuscuta epithymum]